MGIKRYKCEICDKLFDVKYRLISHTKEVHTAPEARDHLCDKCDSTFRNKWSLQRHKALVHDRIKSCNCSVCGVYIPNSYNLSMHMRTHIDAKPFVCAYEGCKASFKNKSDLKKHTPKHYPAMHVICDLCGRAFSRKPRLVKHIRRMHNVPRTKSEECGLCGDRFLTKNYLSKHMRQKHGRNRKKYICDMCDFVTHNKPSIVMHIKHGHDLSTKTKCTICGKTYKRNAHLKQHYKNTHDIRFKTKSRTVPSIKIKEEPMDLPDLEIDLLDIEKNEPFTGYETEFTEDVSKIYAHDTKDQRLHELFKKMIHDPKHNPKGNEPGPTIAKDLGNQTRDTQMPLEDLVQQDLLLVVVGDKQASTDAAEATDANKTVTETRTEDPQLKPSLDNNEGIQETTDTSHIPEEIAASRIFKQEITESTEDTVEDIQNEESPDNTTANETQLTQSQESETVTESGNLTEDTPRNTPMPVEEFIQQVISNNDPVDDTYIINQESEDFVKKRIKELITNQRVFDKIMREDFGRRVLKRVTEEEVKTIKTDTRKPIVSKPKSSKIITEKKGKARKLINKEGKVRRKRRKKKANGDSEASERDGITKKRDQLIINSFQCNVCYKLFETKPQLMEHCQVHFDLCSVKTLCKCPLCNFVADKNIMKHFRTVHKEDINISFIKILDRKQNDSGSRYYYNTQNDRVKQIEIIPSVKILNKKAGMDLDKRNRERNAKLMSKTKLVKKGKEWIVEKEKLDLSGYLLPNKEKLDNNEDDYLKQLKKLGLEAKKTGVKMLYPCNKCDKVCQNLSAVTLHYRKHDPNKKPFAPKVWRHKIKDSVKNSADNPKEVTPNVEYRTVKPMPIVNKHKCDPKLKEFYENNIRGLNIEFWQFLKIYNKMDRDNVKDFEDLQNSTEYGLGHRYNIENRVEDDSRNTEVASSNIEVGSTNESNTEENLSNETTVRSKKKPSVISRKINVSSVKNTFTRTIRISRKEHNNRRILQMKLREKIASSNNE